MVTNVQQWLSTSQPTDRSVKLWHYSYLDVLFARQIGYVVWRCLRIRNVRKKSMFELVGGVVWYGKRGVRVWELNVFEFIWLKKKELWDSINVRWVLWYKAKCIHAYIFDLEFSVSLLFCNRCIYCVIYEKTMRDISYIAWIMCFRYWI